MYINKLHKYMPKPATYTFTGLFLDCFCLFLISFSISNFCSGWRINRPLVMKLCVNFSEEAGCRFGILSLAKFSKLSKEPILLVHRSPGFLWHYGSMSKNKCECRWQISDVAIAGGRYQMWRCGRCGDVADVAMWQMWRCGRCDVVADVAMWQMWQMCHMTMYQRIHPCTI